MNWFKQAKSNKEFDFSKEKDEIWNDILEQEGKHQGISDLPGENNEPVSDIKDIEIDIQVPEGHNEDQKFKLRAQLCVTSMDWECPLYYFKCQYFQKFIPPDESGKSDRGSYSPENRFIYIPAYEEGNHNLVEENGNKYLKDTDEDDCEYKADKQLWGWIETHACQRIQDFLERKAECENMDDGLNKPRKEFRMF